MQLFILALLCLSAFPQAQAAQEIEFVSPFWQPTTSKNQFDGCALWPLGSSQIVAFSTPWESYRIEFWQGILTGGARMSKQIVYNQSIGETLPQSFTWTVQTYDLQLAESPLFFFWLYNNLNDTQQQSSANFNITLGAVTTSSTSSATSSSKTPGPESTVSSALPGAPTTPSSPNDSDSTNSSSESTGLSTGAVAGIAVGAVLAAVIVIAAIAFSCVRNVKKKRQARAELDALSPPMSYYPKQPLPQPEAPINGYYSKPVEAPVYPNERPVEAPDTSRTPLSELA